MNILFGGRRLTLLTIALALLLAFVALFSAMTLRGNSGPDRNAAAAPFDDLTITTDIAYAPGERHGLDIYAPANAGEIARPVIVYLYGGAWVGGAKEDKIWFAANLARRGYVAVVPDYRLYPPATWPDFLYDNAAALRWVMDNIQDYGGDPDNLVLMGYSAGAFNALSLTVWPRWLESVEMDAGRDLKAVVGLSGVYNMYPPDGETEEAIFGPETGFEPMGRHVGDSLPPVLFLVGSSDRVARPRDSEQLMAQIHAKGGVAQLVAYDGLGHEEMQAAGGDAIDAPETALWDDITRFLEAHGVVVPSDTAP